MVSIPARISCWSSRKYKLKRLTTALGTFGSENGLLLKVIIVEIVVTLGDLLPLISRLFDHLILNQRLQLAYRRKSFWSGDLKLPRLSVYPSTEFHPANPNVLQHVSKDTWARGNFSAYSKQPSPQLPHIVWLSQIKFVFQEPFRMRILFQVIWKLVTREIQESNSLGLLNKKSG